MKFYFDESGNFQVPAAAGEHRVGIVSGVVIPESDEAEIFRRFDAFVASLPATAFHNGEPKGRLLGDAERNELAHMIVDLPGKILFCPIMLDLTTLFGRPEADIVGLVMAKLHELEALCRHDTMRRDVGELAADVSRMSTQQVLRLAAWAKCISRAMNDSVILHCGAEYHPAWSSVHFEIDPVEQNPGSREERVFSRLLPAWVTRWSQSEPLVTIQDTHTKDHPFIRNWGLLEGIDVGKMFRSNVHYVSSTNSKGIQLADMTASLVRRAVVGLANACYLQNYGFMMTRTVGEPLHACGLFSFAPGNIRDLERRYAGVADAINGARESLPGSYCRA